MSNDEHRSHEWYPGEDYDDAMSRGLPRNAVEREMLRPSVTTTYDPSTSTDCPVITLRPALRAIDEREIADKGPLVAVLRSPTLETMVRRASLVLFRDDVTPAELVTVLGMWAMLHPALVA